MAVRSRSTLRVPVRREEDHDSNVHHHQHHHPHPPRPSVAPTTASPHRPRRRRKSSPDLLDTTTPDLPRRTSTRLSNAPENHEHHHTPPLRLLPRHVTPTATTTTTTTTSASSTPPTSIFLRGGARESPDPLDTISPATQSSSKRPSGPIPSSAPRHPPHHRSRVALAPTTDTTSPRCEPGASSAPTIRASSRPNPTPAPDTTNPPKPAVSERRSLRSHDGASRGRSELALYFPNYEQLLSLEPPKPEFLAGNTAIRLINDLTDPPHSVLPVPDTDTDTPFGNPLIHLHNCETISLPTPKTPNPSKKPRNPKDPNPDASRSQDEDPLSEAVYFRPHRRNERQEKQLRNIERDRAQHEKQQLDRLLDELQGHDWPRVMGISVLSGPEEKKQYESKRAFFVQEISALLQKFKIWKEEEKRRKLEKESLALQNPSDNLQPTTTKRRPKRRREHSHPAPPTAKESEGDSAGEDDSSPNAALSDAPSYGEPPDINDVDAWAARQLLQEARSATGLAKKKSKPTATTGAESRKKKAKGDATLSASAQEAPPPPPPPNPPPDDKPFTSFYAKPHLRETALSTHRKGRVRLAFGHPIPDMEEREFELPPGILTPEAIDACRRERRRRKRARLTDG
ncbi:something about silencing, SAS, complex subunit 4-domain-containing protein [Aspergillus ambiguus]|uniref:acetyltransferase SAS4-like domain-containing protein n=1 Tax=Aspergillus ambiguus TaxID=176160 RepID=UPI003CCE485B